MRQGTEAGRVQVYNLGRGTTGADPIQISLLITLINNDIQRSFQATRLRSTMKEKEKRKKKKRKENPCDRSIKSGSDRALKPRGLNSLVMKHEFVAKWRLLQNEDRLRPSPLSFVPISAHKYHHA